MIESAGRHGVTGVSYFKDSASEVSYASQEKYSLLSFTDGSQ